MGISDLEGASLRTVAIVTPSSIACEAPWTEVGRKGWAASPMSAMRACFEIHFLLELEGDGVQWGEDLGRRVSNLDKLAYS